MPDNLLLYKIVINDSSTKISLVGANSSFRTFLRLAWHNLS